MFQCTLFLLQWFDFKTAFSHTSKLYNNGILLGFVYFCYKLQVLKQMLKTLQGEMGGATLGHVGDIMKHG